MITAADIDILARTVYGEARGEPLAGKVAVAHVAINRWKSKRWYARDTVAATCTLPAQFSCWNAGDPNRATCEAVTLDDDDYRVCMFAALGAVTGLDGDPTDGATHYYARSLKRAPSWAQGKAACAIIGQHLFFKGIA